MNDLPKTLFVVGGLLVLAGGIAWLLNRAGIILGKLPGDIFIEKDRFRFNFPWVTCLLVSAAISLTIRLWEVLFPQ